MDPASIAALLKQGGLFALAVLASYLAWDYRKELRAAHQSYGEELRQARREHAAQIRELQGDRIDDLKADRQLYMQLMERITEEMTRGRHALEAFAAAEGMADIDDDPQD